MEKANRGDLLYGLRTMAFYHSIHSFSHLDKVGNSSSVNWFMGSKFYFNRILSRFHFSNHRLYCWGFFRPWKFRRSSFLYIFSGLVSLIQIYGGVQAFAKVMNNYINKALRSLDDNMDNDEPNK
jgi:hypothetical protein